MRIVGIDPGITGALALTDEDETGGTIPRFLDFLDMPTVGEDAQRHVDETALNAWLREARPDHVWLERVTAMPSQPGPNGERRGMGATSAFHFGDTVATIRTTIRLGRWPMSLVVPGKWKKFYGLKGPDKEQSRQRALQLVPSAAEFLARKKDHARAEALLLARYGAVVARADRGQVAPALPPVPAPDEVPD